MISPRIQTISETLSDLATLGGHVVEETGNDWLERCGVALPFETDPCRFVPTRAFLKAALPARDKKDLLRKTLIRHPRYRLNLDLDLCRVMVAIGTGNRWERLQEILAGKLHPLAPRLVAIAKWMGRRHQRPLFEITEREWDATRAEVMGDDAERFREWSEFLWGNARNATEIFPLLEELYVPLVDQPVHVSSDGPQFSFFAGVIAAANSGDSVRLEPGDVSAIDDAILSGLPLDFDGDSRRTWLTLGAEMFSDNLGKERGSTTHPAPLGLAKAAVHSGLLSRKEQIDFVRKDPEVEGTLTATFVGLMPDSLHWPEENTNQRAPVWSRLPSSSVFKRVTISRTKSPEVDEALLLLSEHPVFGLLLQIFLAEALDREMGEESIILSPPLDRKVECIEGETDFLYRPLQREEVEGLGRESGFVGLGKIDEVFDYLAASVGTTVVPLPFPSRCPGVWSLALRLFIDVEIVIGREDRWALSAAVLDRLYGGDLMRDIIRGQRHFREGLHRYLTILRNEREPKQSREYDLAI